MIRAIGAALVALLSATPASAQPADITGTWTVVVMRPSGPTPPAMLVLKKNGEKLTGVLSGPQGDMPVEAAVENTAVTIWFTVPTQNGPIAITMKGTVDGDAMKGTADLGGQGESDWTGRRGSAAAGSSAGSAADVSGTWAVSVETPAGSGTPTFVLKQEGEKVTGTYTGQLGEAPVTGTVKGSAIEFSFDLTVQGTALHVTYAGTVEGATMKGTVKLGELGDGTFTGKKQ